MLARMHDVVFGRRVRVLARHLAPLLPSGATVLDVGCGDGSVAAAILQLRPDVRIEGVDVLVRPMTHIPVAPFDGRTIPRATRSVACVLFVDVLHHADDPIGILREARRVTAGSIVVKDHGREGMLAGPTLRAMDWVGNARHGVSLPYTYWTRKEWDLAFHEASLKVTNRYEQIGLYPWPASLLFDRQLHFIAEARPG